MSSAPRTQALWFHDVGDTTCVAVGAGADEATLIWSPHPPADIRGHASASTSVKKEASDAVSAAAASTVGHARFLRRWSAHGLQEDALEALWRAADVCALTPLHSPSAQVPHRMLCLIAC